MSSGWFSVWLVGFAVGFGDAGGAVGSLSCCFGGVAAFLVSPKSLTVGRNPAVCGSRF
ncbi:hypothetical protein BN1012_Phect361 [Candidatus Phaeomarinobacter ectocarpi]|uniref:Uncharacterized protein n=1 Tax=Candidatus Phaeomarinibacter ectocarpi TaxID=1458461 RepID=X5MKH2_9HYPH|nr:hypothetical protein BN1012_Phect361 [Candidatus Phaeomarinobacter ectocarpi]